MEVSNLLLGEQPRAGHHESTRTQQYAATANQAAPIYPSTTLPAIKPLHEDELLDARSSNDNDIQSLTLRPVDWQAWNAEWKDPPSEPKNGVAQQHAQALSLAEAKWMSRPIKSGAPIAEVLNQVSPVVKHALRVEEAEEPDEGKRRKLEAPGGRTLPKPSPAAKQKSNKRQLLPPLLVPLHEPPPNAGLIPSMTTEGIRRPMDKVSSREELHAEAQQYPVVSVERVASAEREKPTGKENVKKAAVVQKAQPTAKSRRVRHTWEEEETSDLLRGVARFGIGNWKKILECSDYQFQNRTAVDLKDRFRTCCPEEYRKVGSTTEKPQPKNPPAKAASTSPKQTARRKKSGDDSQTEKSSKFEHKLPDELARLGIEGPFPKAQRRTRRGFSGEEDEAILRGFEKYGAKWTKIQSDPELGLSSRSRTDLRDRFRNKFPGKFIETGHKFKQKDACWLNKENIEDEDRSSMEKSRPSSVVQATGLQAPSAAAVQEVATAPLVRLLVGSIHEPHMFHDFGDDITPEPEDQRHITLSRNIFDWADQNSRHATVSLRADPMTQPNAFETSKTITTMDQFHMNPMVALKVPHHHTGHVSGGGGGVVGGGKENFGAGGAVVVAAPSNRFPQLPLAGILNGPVSLPSAAELASGIDGDDYM
jgi:hypothetical protein